ncbi:MULTISPECIES: CDP-archaeol synthase [unclassified Ruminococcus]|uniref:phosphatidate cytidylyltransferase n=1 Tax=unclassified Ruminococcus TaxID=2608920 RepID=UPI00210E8DBF|nr:MULTISPECIES: CDP-archaeol synthase [unclassified Ruminococcus]MCQ4021865.1 CDP-archaeol synthase [Ruminococcus sp. zg-924]MCQ4114310.1 CDP-archaeol synthase [Ruminococcus sp. zg-921]
MKTRIISGVTGSAIVAAMLIAAQYAPIMYNILVALVALVCVTEIFSARGLTQKPQIIIPSAVFAALMPILFTLGYWHILAIAYVFAMFIMLLAFSDSIKFDEIAFAFTTTTVITVGMGTIVFMCDKNTENSLFYIMMSLAIPWVADAGAYFAGSLLGKHKLCPKISPKKTVEGAVGGLLAGVLGAVIFAVVFQCIGFKNGEQVQYLSLVIMALLGGVVSIIGDLSFSAIKRSCHVKDYGSVIPGHGGILDRCDSVIFTAPFLMLFIEYFPILVK